MSNRTQNSIVVLVGVAAAWWLLSQVFTLLDRFADVLAIFGFAWMLNLLLEPLVERLSRWFKGPFAWTLGYLSILLVLAALSAPVAAQASALPAALPAAVEQTTHQIDSFLGWLRTHRIAVPPTTTRFIENGELAQQVGPTMLSWSLSMLSVGGQFLLVVGVAAAMSAGDDSLRAIARALLPDRWTGEAQRLYKEVRRTYSAAIRGQLAIWAMGMALSLGVMAVFQTPGWILWIGPLALVRLLPYLGGILGAGLTVIILLLSLPWPASLLPVIIVIIGQNIMGYIVEPRLLGRVLSLSPGLVLFVVLVGWKLGGITGIAFGVPAVAVVQALAERVIRRRESAPPTVVAAPA
ncbi:MAG: AI-2E family transporter, partial [Chloroflexales bacterium]|nr:AI-2E family transporter [Chloroflexales bacterium]